MGRAELPPPGLADRWAQRRAGWLAAHPRVAGVVAAAGTVAAWTSLVATVVAATAVPYVRHGLAGYVAMLVPAVQVLVVATPTRTLGLSSLWRWVTVGVAANLGSAAVSVGLLRLLAPAVEVASTAGSVALAGPVEEAAKLVPLGLWAWATRRRVAAWSATDWAVAAGGVGAGLGAAEELARRIVYFHAVDTSLLGRLLAPPPQEVLRTADPLSWQPVTFGEALVYPGHATAGALMGVAVGLALTVGVRRGWVGWLPAAAFGWVTIAHVLANAEASGYLEGPAGPLLGAVAAVWDGLGAGAATRWLLAAGLAATLVVDARRLRAGAWMLHPLPATPGLDGLLVAGQARLGALDEPWRSRLGTALYEVVDLARHAATSAAALLAGRATTTGRWLRARRNAGYGFDPPALAPAVAVVALLAAVGAAAALVALPVVHARVQAADAAYVAGTLAALADWWTGLAGWQQWLTLAGVGGLLLAGGVPLASALWVAGGVGAGLDHAGWASRLLADPRATLRQTWRSATPATVATGVAELGLSRLGGRLFARLGGRLDELAGQPVARLARRADVRELTEDSIAQVARDRARDLPAYRRRMYEGQLFDEVRSPDYPANQVRLTNGKVLDSLDPDRGRIVSRKHTQLAEIRPDTARAYISEVRAKYPPGSVVADTPAMRERYPDLVGEQIFGATYLEVPIQHAGVPQEILDYASSLRVQIRDTSGTILNAPSGRTP